MTNHSNAETMSIDINEYNLCKCIAHWSYSYFDAISMLKYITDKESRKELREQRDYSKKRLFEALAVYQNKYALGPFVVPQSAALEFAKKQLEEQKADK